MSKQVQPSSMSMSNNEFLTIREVKDYLKISQSAAYGLTHSKDFPVSRFGSSIRIPKNEFFAWVASKTVVPAGLTEYLSAVGQGGL